MSLWWHFVLLCVWLWCRMGDSLPPHDERMYRCSYDFVARNSSELSVLQGETLEVPCIDIHTSNASSNFHFHLYFLTVYIHIYTYTLLTFLNMEKVLSLVNYFHNCWPKLLLLLFKKEFSGHISPYRWSVKWYVLPLENHHWHMLPVHSISPHFQSLSYLLFLRC